MKQVLQVVRDDATDEYPVGDKDKITYTAHDNGILTIRQDLPENRLLATYAPGKWIAVKIKYVQKEEPNELPNQPGT